MNLAVLPADLTALENLPWVYIAPALTYVGGVFSKPLADFIGKWLDARRDRNRLRNALYQELGANVDKLISYTLAINSPGDNAYADIDGWERREVLDFALKTQPVLFRELREANVLNDFYFAQRRLRALDKTAQQQQILSTSSWIQSCIKKGPLSRSKMSAAVSQHHILYPHPLRNWLQIKYYKVIYRNTPKVTEPSVAYVYDAVDSLPKKVLALWTGTPPGRKRVTRSPVGDQQFGAIYSDLESQRQPKLPSSDS